MGKKRGVVLCGKGLTPFDKARFEALLGGALQISIVKASARELISLRLDAEYYKPHALKTEKLLQSGQWNYLKKLSESIKSFGAYSLCNQVEYRQTGIPFIRCKDIKSGMINFSEVLYIDKIANALLWKSEIHPEMVLFTMSGTVGNVAIATEDLSYPINSNQDIAKITTNDKLNPYYLSIFLQTKQGVEQVERLPIGSVQQHIFVWQIEQMIIPLFGKYFVSEVERCFKLALLDKKKSGLAFSEAQNLLLSRLGLLDWKPEHQLSFVKTLSDIEQAGRIDAEYYQPKYEDIIKAVKACSSGWKILGKLVELTSKNFKPLEQQEYHYIELANIGESGEVTGCTTAKGHDLPSRARRKVSANDVIVSSIEGSLSSIALIEEEYNEALCSTGFHVIKSSQLNSETLLIFLKSFAGQMQLKKGCNGTILTAINKDEFSAIVLPVLPKNIQTQIQQKVQESFALRKRSKQLLEAAKRAVEMAIEQDEKTAQDWLKEQVK